MSAERGERVEGERGERGEVKSRGGRGREREMELPKKECIAPKK